MNTLTHYKILIQREFLISMRLGFECAYPILFFLIIVILFPLAIGSNSHILSKIAPGVVWVGALIASILALDNMLKSDFHDGCLELLVLSPYSLSSLIIIKVMSHWLLNALPLILLSPLLAYLYHLSSHAMLILMLSLLIGTPILYLLGGICLGLTLTLGNQGLLLALLVLPLYVPVLIFGSNSVYLANSHLPVVGQLTLLLGLLFFALTLAPIAAAYAIRIGLMEG